MYAHIENGQIDYVGPIPQNWRNVSSLNALSNDELAEFGWFPVMDETPDYDGRWQVTGAASYQIETAHVVMTKEVVALSLEAVKTRRLSELAALRYTKETGGIEVSGQNIKTDRESQAMLNGALAFVTQSPAALIDWKVAPGEFVQLNAAQITAIATAVAQHVQACFSAEKDHAELIANCNTPQAAAQHDITVGWP